MDKPEVFIKREQPVLNWVPPSGDVGSVLIYRAEDNISDSVGSRTILTTLDNDIITYTDSASGSQYNVYRIQFWNGVGSSPMSNPVSPRTSEILAQIGEVKTLARISSNADVGSNEIYMSIKDASNWVFREYGDPIKKTAIVIDSDDSDESYCYDFTGDMGPVYQIRRMTVDSPEEELVSGSSWIVDFNQGLVKFDSTFIDIHETEYVQL